MPLFRYKAIEAGGKEIKGVVDAESLVNAKDRLQKQKILVISLEILQAHKALIKLTSSALLSFTREMAQLLKAGLPLYESLLTIEEKQRKSPSHALFADLCDKLKVGSSLSQALERYHETFPTIYISMIRSAEQSGSLEYAFEQLLLLLSKQQKLKKQLFGALAYPAFLGGFCLFIIAALFLFVIPSMEELFEGRTLHPLTQTVLSLSHFLHKWSVILTCITLLCILGIVIMSRVPHARQSVQRELFCRTPYLKDILLGSTFVRFFRSMNMLLSGGIPIVEAIGHSKAIVNSSLLAPLLKRVEVKLIEGKKLSELFAECTFIPPLVIRMLHIGEETGTMATMMQNLADIYEEDLDKNLSQIMVFLQPALLLFLGAVVGIVVLSILLPLTDVSSFTNS